MLICRFCNFLQPHKKKFVQAMLTQMLFRQKRKLSFLLSLQQLNPPNFRGTKKNKKEHKDITDIRYKILATNVKYIKCR